MQQAVKLQSCTKVAVRITFIMKVL